MASFFDSDNQIPSLWNCHKKIGPDRISRSEVYWIQMGLWHNLQHEYYLTENSKDNDDDDNNFFFENSNNPFFYDLNNEPVQQD